MNISKVSESDLETLREVAITTFRDSFGDQNTPEDLESYERTNLSAAQLKKELHNPFSHFFFVKVSSKVVGYLKLNEFDAQTERDVQDSIEIERIYLLSTYQGRGFGKLLLDEAMKFARSKGCKVLWLGVWEKNVSAIRFYERGGFKIFGSHKFLLGKDLQTDFLMKLKLPPLTKN